MAGGLERAALHEIVAEESGDAAAASAFAAALTLLAGGGRICVWIRDARLESENGRLYAPGMVEEGG